MKRPFKRYRPMDSQTDDGQGGFVEDSDTYDENSATLIWGVITVHEEETRIHVDIREDVLVDDVIEVEED